MLVIPIERFAPAASGRAGVVVQARRAVQGLGGAALIGGAAAMPWAEFTAEGIALGSVRVSPLLLGMFGLLVCMGVAGLVWSGWGLLRRLPARTLLGVALIAGAGLLSLAGLEYGYLRPGGLSAYEYRPAARLVGYTLGIALLACALPAGLGLRIASALRGHGLSQRWVLLLAGTVVVLGGLIGWRVLDGMPHITDGTAYLLEARTLWSGRLALDPPMHPALFERELLAFRLSEAGYFGKYPVGWPLVLGGFDTLGVPWLANAALAGVLVLLTYAVVAERGGRPLAGWSAAAVALCPWLWLNAGTMMSHLASAVWLWAFLWLLLRGLRTGSRVALALAGLALGAAVLTRPADAAFFALPCVVVALFWFAKDVQRWRTRLPLVALGALPGVIVYLWVGRQLAAGGSTYGDGHGSTLFSQTPTSVAHGLAWLHEGWVGLGSMWFAGAAPAAVLVVCGAVFGRRLLRGQGLAIACGASVFLCYAVFVFGGRAWVGPRWYVPLVPVGALLIAAGLRSAARAARAHSAGGVLAAGYLRVVGVGVAVVLLVVVPVKIVELVQRPPHGIDGGVVRTVEQAGLDNAVVALPESGLDPATGQPNYKRGIAGMWTMHAPFESSPVIYVAAVDGWERMASEAWPGRSLYQMNGTTGDYKLTPVPEAAPVAEVQP